MDTYENIGLSATNKCQNNVHEENMLCRIIIYSKQYPKISLVRVKYKFSFQIAATPQKKATCTQNLDTVSSTEKGDRNNENRVQ